MQIHQICRVWELYPQTVSDCTSPCYQQDTIPQKLSRQKRDLEVVGSPPVTAPNKTEIVSKATGFT